MKQSELDALKRDVERLNWFEKNGKWIETYPTLIDAPSMTFEMRWHICLRDRSWVSPKQGYATLREAIDAGMEISNEEE